MHSNEVGLADLLDGVLVDVERSSPLWRVELVDLGLLLDQVLCQLFVLKLTHVERFADVLPHLLLFEVFLPLLHLEVLLVDLLQILVHFFVLPQRRVLLIDLLLDFELAGLHVFQLDLPGNERLALTPSGCAVTEIEQTVGVAVAQT